MSFGELGRIIGGLAGKVAGEYVCEEYGKQSGKLEGAKAVEKEKRCLKELKNQKDWRDGQNRPKEHKTPQTETP